MMISISRTAKVVFVMTCLMFPLMASGEEQKKHFLTLSGIVQVFSSSKPPIPHKAIFGPQIEYTRLFPASRWGFGGGISGAFLRGVDKESRSVSLFLQAAFGLLQRKHRLLLSAGPEFGHVVFTDSFRDPAYPKDYDPDNPVPGRIIAVVVGKRATSGHVIAARIGLSWISPWHISASANYSMGSLINQSVFLGCATFTVGIHL